MGEYAYDFTGQERHDGPSRNPHDLSRMTGGSSGGSGAAVAGGLAPIALGSDTNGSIRVPSSFCGFFGLKPTYGRLSRAGTFPFVASLDHVGPMARSVGDLALAYDAMLGSDGNDPAQADIQPSPVRPSSDAGVADVRIAKLGGFFAKDADPVLSRRSIRWRAPSRPIAWSSLPTQRGRGRPPISSPWPKAPLSISSASRLGPADFDPEVRDRLIAGAMLPGAWISEAQKFRRTFHTRALELFRDVDVLLAPATPCQAPKIGEKTFLLGGKETLLRPNIGVFTQPISFIGLPVVAVPVWRDGGNLPIGVQVIAPPWREDLALRVARALERDGVVSAPVAAYDGG